MDGVFDEYEGIVKTLEEIKKSEGGKSGAKAEGLRKKIVDTDFIGTLYLLKHMLYLVCIKQIISSQQSQFFENCSSYQQM